MVPAALSWLLGGFVLTVLLELALLEAGRRLRIVALPNERSSHSVPTPTLGGLPVVVVVCAFLGVEAAVGVAPAWGVLAGGLLLAVVGALDDLRELRPSVRLVCQVVAAGLTMSFLGLDWSLALVLLAGLALVWLINLFNFMDGIDGIAGVQVLLFCVGAQLAGGGIPGWPGGLCWVLGASTLGFLAFNWPPAKIFMGDAGSGFLGLLLGFLAFALAQTDVVPLVASLILLAGFWFDASYTLCVRIVTGQRFAQAHRLHLYQKLALVKGHRWTTLSFAAYGAAWLVPLAILSARAPEWSPVLLIAALAPVAYGCVRWSAGRPDVDRGAADD
jgi:Fuc2NAc and GlcNAc transferase